MKPIIEIKNVSKEYTLFHKLPYYTLRDTVTNVVKKPLDILRGKTGSHEQEKFLALKDINFSIQQGERVGIIGRNGAGKSTLLKILSQITPPTTGEIILRGRVASLLEVGTGFHPELTGRENIYLNGAILGMKQKEIAKKFDEIVAFAEIEKFLDTPVKRYSSGMYVRLAFAVAAHLEPEILIVDEVLAVGDTQFQKKCLGKMEEVGKSGRTILFVSHNMAAIKALCTRGVYLQEGKIFYDGKIEKTIEKYLQLTHTVGASTKNINDAMYAYRSGHIDLISVELHNPVAGQFRIYWKQPIEITCKIRVVRATKNLSFGLRINSMDGIPVWTIHNNNTNPEQLTLSPGIYEIHITAENALRSGTYQLIFGANETIANTPVYYIPNAVELEVLDTNLKNDIYHHDDVGVVNGSAQWSITSIS